MFVGVARCDFLVPNSASLKDKRRVVRGMIDLVTSKFNASAAEVDFMDLRQRGAVGVTCLSNSSFHTKRMLVEIERVLRAHPGVEVLSVTGEVMRPDD